MKNKKLVMYIDDTEAFRRYAKKHSTRFSNQYTLETFSNYKELEKALTQQLPDLLVLDNCLEEDPTNGEMRGSDLIAKYSKEYPKLSMVLYSSVVPSSLRIEVIRNGAVGAIAKNPSPDTFSKLVKLFANKKSKGLFWRAYSLFFISSLPSSPSS